MKILASLIVLAATLASANETTYQIEIQGQFVAVEKASLDGCGSSDLGGMVDVAALSRLRADGRARLLHSPRLLTPAGMEATVKSVEEVIYPTDFSVDLITNLVGKTAAVVRQASFETREVGVIFTVLPEVDINLRDIRLVVQAEIVDPPTWQTYAAKYVDSTGMERTVDLQQPFFRRRSVTTSVTLKNGSTAVAGGGMTDMEGQTSTFLLLTARLVDSEGKPIKIKDAEQGAPPLPSAPRPGPSEGAR
jgi:type II secretory pathway component GspD/PulD (secretin)